jgi:glycosyltransferase involved in cell wall biosynthesis
MNKEIRVFIGLTEIAGYYKGLKYGFDQLGIKCTFINLSNHPFKYGGDYQNILVKSIKFFYKKRVLTLRRNIIFKIWWFGWEVFFRIVLFIWALFKHNVFIFGFNSSFLFFYDLPVLKFFGRKIIYQFHGSDSRPPYLDGAIMSSANGFTIEQCIQFTKNKKRIIRTIDKYANIVIDTPPQGHFHERPFVIWLEIGLPIKPEFIPPKVTEQDYQNNKNSGEVRVLHSPSSPEAKGSNEIQEVIERLNSQGFRINFVQIRGKSNVVVLDELQKCDFVIDQLYSDYGMPGFATESAWFGKPVIICGYAKELWENILTSDKLPPTLYCYPDELEKVIKKLIEDKSYRFEIGQKLRDFVENQWDPKKIAERYIQLIKGDIPQEWIYDPKNIRYVHGVGLSEDKGRKLLKDVIEQGGKEALQVSDKPELEKLLIDFAEGLKQD